MEPVLLRARGVPESRAIATYLAAGGYEGLKKALAHGARRGDQGGPRLGAARPRRRRLPDRAQVELRPQGPPGPALPRLQRRRVRARDVQGPRDHRARPAPGRRGRSRSPRTRSGPTPPTSTSAASSSAGRGSSRRRSTRRESAASSARTSWAAGSTSTSGCTAAPARTSAARRRRCSSRSKASAASRASSRRSRRSSGSFGKPTVVNNVETLACVPHIMTRGAAWFASIGRPQATPARSSSASPGT